jgi:hypothetical protein
LMTSGRPHWISVAAIFDALVLSIQI